MSLTWSPDSPAPGNQTNGMPRRSAKRICLPNFAAAGATSTRDPPLPQRRGDPHALGAVLLGGQRDQDAGRRRRGWPTGPAARPAGRAAGRRRSRCPRPGRWSCRRRPGRRSGRRSRSSRRTPARRAGSRRPCRCSSPGRGRSAGRRPAAPGRAPIAARITAARASRPSSRVGCSTPRARTRSTNDEVRARRSRPGPGSGRPARRCAGLDQQRGDLVGPDLVQLVDDPQDRLDVGQPEAEVEALGDLAVVDLDPNGPTGSLLNASAMTSGSSAS